MMEKKNKETEFNQFWEQHHKQLILNAPKELRDEYVESTQLNSPLDWLCFILPLGIGILVQPYIRLGSEILSWLIMVVIVVVLFALMQMVLYKYFQAKMYLSKIPASLRSVFVCHRREPQYGILFFRFLFL